MAVTHKWSPTAGVAGFTLTISLCMVSDIRIGPALAVLFPAPVILGRLFEWVHLVGQPRWWMILLAILLSAIGDALWYMLLAETLRLLVHRVNRACSGIDT
jgi:hypothetical protein